MILGSIRCATSSVTLNAIFAKYGLQALASESDFHFDVVSMTRRSDPVVERDLFDRALHNLEAAHIDGAIPVWRRA